MTFWPENYKNGQSLSFQAKALNIMDTKKGSPGKSRRSVIFGADNGIRTRDPQLGKLMLYQLSYVRIVW